MKIFTRDGQLHDLAARVARAAAAGTSSPVLTGILFRAEKGEGDAPGTLTLAATDAEISITLKASALVERPGAAVVPAKALLQYTKTLSKNADVTLEAEENGSTATITASGQGRSQGQGPGQINDNTESRGASIMLRCFPAKDFPAPAVMPDGAAFSVDAEKLAESVARVMPFVSSDHTKPVLTGALLALSANGYAPADDEEESENDAPDNGTRDNGARENVTGPSHMRLVATDSFRLRVDSLVATRAGGPANGSANGSAGGAYGTAAQVIVPARALREAAKFAALGVPSVDVLPTENACFFSVGGGALVLRARLIDGAYPGYERLLPESVAHSFRAERDDLQAALGRMRVLANATPPVPVTLSFAREEGTLGEGDLTLSISNPNYGAATEVVPAVVPEGTDFTVCVNPAYLADAVNTVDSTAVRFDFNGPMKPAILRSWAKGEGPAATEKDKPENAHPLEIGAGGLSLVMPMRDPSKQD